MNKKNQVASSTVSAELFAAKPLSVLLSRSCPSYWLVVHLARSFNFFLVFFLCEGRYVETPGTAAAVEVPHISSLPQPDPTPQAYTFQNSIPQHSQRVSQSTATFEKPRGYLDDLRYAHQLQWQLTNPNSKQPGNFQITYFKSVRAKTYSFNLCHKFCMNQQALHIKSKF